MKRLTPLIVIIIFKFASSQDTQYWSQQYGTESFYLGGAVIGSLLDLSASYYNPGALALMENPEFLTGAKSVSLTRFRFVDGAGAGHDFESLRADAPPDLFAGLFTFGKRPQDRLVYSFLVRKRIDFRVYSSADDLRNIENGESGNDKYFGMTNIEWKVNESWVGFTYSKLLNDNIGLGFTQYFCYFGLYNLLDINTQALTEDGEMPITHLVHFVNSYNIKTLTKLGVFLKYSPLKLGFTMSLPSINLFGNGDFYSNDTYASQDYTGIGAGSNYMDAYYIEDAKSHYPSSWTIGFGLSYKINHSQIHFSTEWFAAVKPFNHLDLPAVVNKTTGETEPLSLMQEYKSVTNFGIGWKHVFNDHFSLFGGFTTDFTSTPPGSLNDISLSDWDIYQISAGTVFSYKWIKMNTGIKYAFGKERAQQLVNYPTATSDNLLLGDLSNSNIDYKSIKIVIGFSLRMLAEKDNVQKIKSGQN